MAIPTIKELEDELVGLIESLPQFKDKAFSIFSLDDLERLTEGAHHKLPIAGVGYNGCTPVEGNSGADPKAPKTPGMVFVNMQFIVVMAVSYNAPGENDNKQAATDLLGAVRGKVVGYMKANTRAWRFIGERPEPEGSGDGLIFYSQVWETIVAVRGTST